MKGIIIALLCSAGILSFFSCSKNDCVCTSTYSLNGVVQSSSSSSSGGSGIPGPAGSAGNSDICNSGDYYYSSTNYNGDTEVNKTECELE